ncbi:MAG: isoprenoid biosynthesis glyoxalase ElbB [Planctomycetes bacterium]|nr:isoprenoid biosynthesis glyoxalase ElbB [Planctomycetota bacterium]
MTKVAVVLSGCGVNDGAEIHESVLMLLALDRLGAEAVCAAPNVDQMDVIDHSTGKRTAEKRNVLKEAARIARGAITDVAKLKAADVDAVVLPGGFGAAKNLCDFARGEEDWRVNADVGRFLKEMHAAKKPIGAACIAPAVLARLFGNEGVRLTIGSDAGTAARLEAAGARHEKCAMDEIVVDQDRKIVTTPAYMLANRISQVAAGIDKLCAAVLRMAH